MRRECRERFPRHQFQRKPLVTDPGMHHGTCVTHVPWCMSGLLTRGGGGNVPGIPGACATRNFTYLARGTWPNLDGGSTKPPLKLKHSWVITRDCWTWMCSFIHALIKCKKSEKCETRLIVCGIRQHTYQNACTLIKVFTIFQSPTKWQTSRRWHLWMQLYERWILF